MDTDILRALVELMERNGLVELEYEANGVRVKLRRGEAAPAITPTVAPPRAAVAETGPQKEAAAPAAPPANMFEFRSPLVGTFYRSPKPDADPFVQPGDEVGPDTVLCIIEAMKVMNEIKAETRGRIREVLVKNGQAVEFGQPLFLIERLP
jgi:acetyl-CoA carboxylase biotin carboxyl carrier protein